MVEGIRNMLETSFDTLYIVSNESSLVEGAERLRPAVVIVDLALVPGRTPEVLQQVRKCSPHSKLLLLSVHDQASVARFALETRADDAVLKRAIASDLLPAVDAVLANRRFVSPGFAAAVPGDVSDNTA
jgi:two-component system secretion response regulator SsrB